MLHFIKKNEKKHFKDSQILSFLEAQVMRLLPDFFIICLCRFFRKSCHNMVELSATLAGKLPKCRDIGLASFKINHNLHFFCWHAVSI
jgi:hypothetical protein